MKIFYSLLGIVSLGIIMVYGGMYLFRDAGSSNETTVDFETEWLMVPDASQTLSLTTQSGSLPVKNFLTNNETVRDVVNPNQYVLAGSIGYCLGDGSCPSGYRTDKFSVRYDHATEHFTISLLSQPLLATRQEMERFMTSRLGLPPSDLCSLSANVGVPFFVSSELAGQNLGFTGCPNAVSL